jgi:peptidoglycan/xylan/chitin deacetylase (PgdA/CDA1 family)
MILLILILSFLIFSWGVIYPFTDYFVRLLAPEIIRQGTSKEKKICLTFDDGPDPLYTPVLLQLLQTADIPAVFFLVGRKAENHPELVKAILSAGHEIGAHTYYHRHAYSLFLKRSLDTIRQGVKSLQTITGKPLVYFRPPWGALNLFQYLYAKKMGYKVVLWTANAGDWDIQTQPHQIIERLVRKTKPGTIIVLHDSGGDPGAPRNTMNALPGVIEYFKTHGYQFVSLQEICGISDGIQPKGGASSEY